MSMTAVSLAILSGLVLLLGLGAVAFVWRTAMPVKRKPQAEPVQAGPAKLVYWETPKAESHGHFTMHS
jgi:hypothetical protein